MLRDDTDMSMSIGFGVVLHGDGFDRFFVVLMGCVIEHHFV